MFGMILRFVGATLFPVALTALFYYFEKKGKFDKFPYTWKQILIGSVFGVIACLATQFGIPYEGAVLNVRSSSPLLAGLVFGAPAGIIAGVIGGVYRYFYVYLFNLGQYTQIACTVATLFAGLFGAWCRKFVFDNKKPGWVYGLAIGIATEVFHMILVFLTNMSDINKAFGIVKICAFPMIGCNAISVAIGLFVVSLMGKEKIFKREAKKQISQIFVFFLLICVVLAFGATCLFTYFMQTNMSKSNAESLLRLNLSDVEDEVKIAVQDEDPTDGIQNAVHNRHIGESGRIVVCIVISEEEFVIIADSNAQSGLMSEDTVSTDEEDLSEDTLFTAEVADVECYCMYSLADEYLIIATLPVSEAMRTRDIGLYITAFMEILVFAALFVHIYLLIKKLVVDNIVKVNDSLSKITDGDLSVRVDVRSSEEFASLSDDINMTVESLKHYIAEAEMRVARELEFARQIQKSVLPKNFSEISRDDLDIYASMSAAKEVGGDFYDFYMAGDNTLMFLVADVSGKGIPGAMFMMRSRTLIKAMVERGLDLDEAFTLANAKLCKTNETGMFITAWQGALDLKTGKLTFVNAGHNPPLIRKKDGSVEFLRERPNFILAGMAGTKYKKHEITLEKGDSIFLYTDGVTEATDTNNCLYGEDRLKKIMADFGTQPSYTFCKTLKEDIDAFVGAAPQFDDITMLCIEYGEHELDGLKLNPKTDDGTVPLAYIEKKCEEYEIPMKLAHKVQISVDEIYTNIASYSGASQATVSLEKKDGKLLLAFEDNGVYFDPTKTDDPDITLSVEDREIGGLGIFMVKKFASAIRYVNRNAKNFLEVEFLL